MADEFDLDLEQLDQQIDKTNKVEKRITDLNQKVIQTSQERDEIAKAKEEAEAEKAAALKERDYYKDFAPALAKYPEASEYQDKIKEKVLAGYSMEDAFVAVLNAEGKLPQAPVQEAKPQMPAGGSAINQPQFGGEKPLEEMTQEEKRQKLIDLENSEGSLSAFLRPSGR